tara:strand:- start:101 stop:370 length:270 start_codon:yes stop_codon:yes gene_type:complete
MFELSQKLISAVTSSNSDNFYGGSEEKKNSGNGAVLALFLSLLVVFVLLMVFGKYLWNNLLTKVVPAVKPVESVWQLIGLWFLFNLLFK